MTKFLRLVQPRCCSRLPHITAFPAERPAATPTAQSPVMANFPQAGMLRPDRGTADQIMFTEAGGVYHFAMGPAVNVLSRGLDQVRRPEVLR